MTPNESSPSSTEIHVKNATRKERHEIVRTKIVDALDARDTDMSEKTDIVIQIRTKRGGKILVSEAIIPYEALKTSMYEYIIVCAFDMIAEKHDKELKGEG